MNKAHSVFFFIIKGQSSSSGVFGLYVISSIGPEHERWRDAQINSQTPTLFYYSKTKSDNLF